MTSRTQKPKSTAEEFLSPENESTWAQYIKRFDVENQTINAVDAMEPGSGSSYLYPFGSYGPIPVIPETEDVQTSVRGYMSPNPAPLVGQQMGATTVTPASQATNPSWERAKDEELVHMALVVYLQALTLDIPQLGSNCCWSGKRYRFNAEFQNAQWKPERMVISSLVMTPTIHSFEVKPHIRDRLTMQGRAAYI
ncbi:hypothetical protein BO71DRAFT_441060 [Aspergillus ellipticus CBS 707.79]|uniref:Uncharacterized protein n=1 Tax=Aspergillus ellipticus CBS 707.79 TaxID=1448320 RepID=A0A319DAH2_9EURO|nr:hypothetical protein BO71DRAFT_441060 [Aspergillus ellipticus CBS 707.79]